MRGRCLNDRIREHNDILKANSGHLGIHCRDCGCSAHFKNSTALGKSVNQLTREIIEAETVMRLEDKYDSTPSVIFSQKVSDYLEK